MTAKVKPRWNYGFTSRRFHSRQNKYDLEPEKNMKILLIHSPATYIPGSAKPSISIPLGLLYVGAILDQAGYDVEIYDSRIGAKLEEHKDTKTGIIHIGDTWETIEKEIERRNPDLIGITNLFTAQLPNAIRVAEIAKKVKSNSIVIVGGNHATVQPEDFFYKTKAVDIVCIGEGEYTMLEIAEAYKDKRSLKNIPGTVVRENGQLKMNQKRKYIDDLDTLPFPAYHLVNVRDYFVLNKMGFEDRPIWRYSDSERTISMITSRGCPFNCIFCSIHSHMGRKWRAHSSDYVLRHLEFVIKWHNVKHIHFEDDNLTLNALRFERIIDGMKERRLNVTWDTPNGVRADSLTFPLLKKFKENRCIYIILGVESGNTRVLSEIIDKRLDLKRVTEAASWCKKITLNLHAFFVIGFPGEKINEMQDTLNFALEMYKKYDVPPTLFIATPLIGTRLYKVCKEKNYLMRETSPENLAKVTCGNGLTGLIETEDFTNEDLHFLVRRFFRYYKIIFARNFLYFFIKNPKLICPFIRKLQERKKKGIKKSVLEIMNLKNCLIRDFSKN